MVETTVKNALLKTPLYVPYNSTIGRKKTADGVTEDNIATLKRYYSSIDAEIYFGDYYVEDVSDIDFSINQQCAPITGFNSYTADHIHIGSRLISGTFIIKFTSPNYLFKILEKAKEGNVLPSDTAAYSVPVHDRNYSAPKGEVNKDLSGQVAGTNREELWPQTFDIDIVYGGKSEAGEAVHIVLQGVRLTGCASMASASSPVPIAEQYSFVAKDIKTLV